MSKIRLFHKFTVIVHFHTFSFVVVTGVTWHLFECVYVIWWELTFHLYYHIRLKWYYFKSRISQHQPYPKTCSYVAQPAFHPIIHPAISVQSQRVWFRMKLDINWSCCYKLKIMHTQKHRDHWFTRIKKQWERISNLFLLLYNFVSTLLFCIGLFQPSA